MEMGASFGAGGVGRRRRGGVIGCDFCEGGGLGREEEEAVEK